MYNLSQKGAKDQSAYLNKYEKCTESTILSNQMIW